MFLAVLGVELLVRKATLGEFRHPHIVDVHNLGQNGVMKGHIIDNLLSKRFELVACFMDDEMGTKVALHNQEISEGVCVKLEMGNGLHVVCGHSMLVGDNTALQVSIRYHH